MDQIVQLTCQLYLFAGALWCCLRLETLESVVAKQEPLEEFPEFVEAFALLLFVSLVIAAWPWFEWGK